MAETVQDLRRLEAWLGSHTGLGPCTTVSRKRPITGFSAETPLLTAITDDGCERGMVVRIDRPGRTLSRGAMDGAGPPRERLDESAWRSSSARARLGRARPETDRSPEMLKCVGMLAAPLPNSTFDLAV